MRVFSLSTNMRAQLFGDVDSRSFSEKILQVGNGTIQGDSDFFDPSEIAATVSSVDVLIEKVFPELQKNYTRSEWLCERAILAPKNTTVNALNHRLLDAIPGRKFLFKSIDSTVTDDDAADYPIEFLNSLEPAGLPSHLLYLKPGCPIMLLRNISQPKLCNGTRLVVKNLYPNVVEATIISGCGKGEDVFIPKIPLIPSNLPFQFRRLQIPIRLCFAMTINKSQGQTLAVAGLDLSENCFSHGQLYVAASRVGSHNNLFIYCPSSLIRNVVYREVLTTDY